MCFSGRELTKSETQLINFLLKKKLPNTSIKKYLRHLYYTVHKQKQTISQQTQYRSKSRTIFNKGIFFMEVKASLVYSICLGVLELTSCLSWLSSCTRSSLSVSCCNSVCRAATCSEPLCLFSNSTIWQTTGNGVIKLLMITKSYNHECLSGPIFNLDSRQRVNNYSHILKKNTKNHKSSYIHYIHYNQWQVDPVLIVHVFFYPFPKAFTCRHNMVSHWYQFIYFKAKEISNILIWPTSVICLFQFFFITFCITFVCTHTKKIHSRVKNWIFNERSNVSKALI